MGREKEKVQEEEEGQIRIKRKGEEAKGGEKEEETGKKAEKVEEETEE